LWNRSQIPLVCGLLAFVRVWSMFSTARSRLVFVMLGQPTILRPAVRQHPAQRDRVLLVERQHPVVQEIGHGQRRLAIVELGQAHLGVGVEERLLVDPPHALERADIEGILRPAVARALALELPVRFLVGLGLLIDEFLPCASVRIRPSWATFASSALSRCFIVMRSCRCQMQRTPAADTVTWS
jgi:hypothetical protein